MPITVKRASINIKEGDDYNPTDVFFGGDVASTVSSWLNNHPEATTTVVDGAITEVKLSNSLRIKKPNFYSDVDSMIADSNLILGMFAITCGYNSIGDGGGSVYSVRAFASGEIEDGGRVIALVNGLVAECIMEAIPYPHYILDGGTATLYAIAENTDITSHIQNVIGLSGVDVVKIPKGTYTLSNKITIPNNKSLMLDGDYHNTSIDPTIIKMTSDNATFELGYYSNFVGGKILTNGCNSVKCFTLNCYNTGIERASIRNTMIIGDKKKYPYTYEQVGVYIECDYPEGETIPNPPNYGYLMFGDFDIYIDEIGIGYHFHRRVSPGTQSGVWITQSDIHGYMRHCNRFIWYDCATKDYANNDSMIDATIQAGQLNPGEAQYPGINIKGDGIVIASKMWDFKLHQPGKPENLYNYPAIYLEANTLNNMVVRMCPVTDYAKTHGYMTTNMTPQQLVRTTGYMPISVSIYNDDDFDASVYISDLQGASYRFGEIVYINCQFKVNVPIPKDTKILSITDNDGLKASVVAQLIRSNAATPVGNVEISTAYKHIVTTLTEPIPASNAWVNLNAICISNRSFN